MHPPTEATEAAAASVTIMSLRTRKPLLLSHSPQGLESFAVPKNETSSEVEAAIEAEEI